MLRALIGDGPSTGSNAAMLIDEYVPEYDVTQVKHAIVDADRETTYEAMLTADLLDLGPAVRLLGGLRAVPQVLSRRLRGSPGPAPPDRMRFADVPETDEWTLLVHEPGEEYVFGAIGKFWRPAIEWRSVDAASFADFDEPGYAKLAIGLSVRPYGDHRTLLTYEARTTTTSRRAERNFRRYWRLIGPFAGYLMRRALARIETDAERAATRASGRPEGGLESQDGSDRGRVRALAAALLLAGAYHVAIRPWHRRWGTSDGEAGATLPGDELLTAATDQVTHGIEIDAPAEAVWPWVVQIGQDRGGFYSYDWLERLVGADIHNVDRVLLEYQDLSEGDTVRLAPEDYAVTSPDTAPEVALLADERALVLRPPEESPTWTWAFVLEPVDEETTRLLARTRSNSRGSENGSPFAVATLSGLVEYLFWEPAHFVMERKMLRGIKRRAERATRAESPASA